MGAGLAGREVTGLCYDAVYGVLRPNTATADELERGRFAGWLLAC